jgi:hypothetical protein
MVRMSYQTSAMSSTAISGSGGRGLNLHGSGSEGSREIKGGADEEEEDVDDDDEEDDEVEEEDDEAMAVSDRVLVSLR